jgi:hypothetical protein
VDTTYFSEDDTACFIWDRLFKDSGLVSGAWSGVPYNDIPPEYRSEWLMIMSKAREGLSIYDFG